ncbi:MAG TPA: DUF2076 domain-containing protein [Acetobacteraceae bacterium]|nr:DUF2076 domain-containing protein [Acetobacteraceae bacterium]
MTPQEKALIDSVFDRLAQTAGGETDAEAAAYIKDRAAKLPDAAYGLTQAVLIQEMALNHANSHITQLEHQLAQASGQDQGSSFLGAAGRSGPWGPQGGQQAPQQPQPQYQAQPQPQYQPQPQQAAGPWGAAPSGGGGFLRNVASMAAGVAGGTLLADGIASLFGGRHPFGGGYGGYGGFGGLGGFGGQPDVVENVENVTVNNYGDPNDPNMNAGQDGLPQTDDAGTQDASFDPSSGDDGSSFDDGGGFGGGSDDFTDV